MIVFNCPECGKEFRVEDSFVGRKGKCTDCKSRFVVPEPGGAAEPAAPKAPGSPSSSTELHPYRQPAPAHGHDVGEEEDYEEEEGGVRNQLPLIVGAGVGGVVLLGLIAAFALSGGKHAPPPDTFVSGEARPAPSPSGASSASAAPAAAPKREKLEPAQIMEKFAEAIVRVEVLDEKAKLLGHGSGFVVDSAGIIVTNFHVIDGAKSLRIKAKDQSEYPVAGVLAVDPRKDFAVLKVTKRPARPWKVVALGDSDAVKPGERVVTIGHSLGFDYTVSDGLCSGKTDPPGPPRGAKFLQISAPISPGNSGGPLFNELGEVIGINTLGFTGGVAQNINFSLPVNEIKDHIADGDMIEIAQALERSVDDLVEAGRGYLEAGDYARAFVTFEAAYKGDAKNVGAVLGYAESLGHAQKPHLAREKFEEALALDGTLVAAYRGLGESYLATGDRARAVVAFRGALARDASDAATLVGLGLTLAALGAKQDVVALVDRAIDDEKVDDPELLSSAIIAYARAGERRKAERCLERLPAGEEHEGVRRICRGLIALESKQPQEAEEHLARAVDAEPNNPLARLLFAKACAEQGKSDEAIKQYVACLELTDGVFYPALVGLARVYDERGLWREALKYYIICVKLSPTDLEANLRLAQMCQEAGAAAESIPYLKTALESSPGYRPCVLALAEAYSATGKREEAADLLLPLARATPPDSGAQIALAEVYLDQGRPNDAVELLDATKARGKGLAKKLFLYGRALEGREEFDQAARAFDEAVSLAPERGAYRFARAVAYARHNVAMGRAALEAYLEWASNREEEAPRLKVAADLLAKLPR